MGKDKITNWLQWLFLGGIVGITCIFVYKNIKVIISYCNTNQGFFSALLGFLAILISVLTYYNQKKEQTKNAQENAKLQRELTEQNNKLQVDLQLRQIKLNIFREKFKCYYALSALTFLRFRVMNSITDFRTNNFNSKILIVTLNSAYRNLLSPEEILENLKKIKLFFDKAEEEIFDEFFLTFYRISVEYLKLEQLNYNFELDVFDAVIQQLYDNFNKLDKLFPYIKKLEHEINLYLIDEVNNT